MSAPASTWEIAVLTNNGKDLSLSTSCVWSSMIPQWPWSVYSHKQVSATINKSLWSFFALRVASWTMPLWSYAPEPTSSFSLGTPKNIIALIPKSYASLISSSNRFKLIWYTPGNDLISLLTLSFSTTKIG